MRICSAANLEVPAYLEIIRRGYHVTRELKPNQSELWLAQNGDHEFEADSPLQLLGLIAVYEGRGENWLAPDKDTDDFIAKYY